MNVDEQWAAMKAALEAAGGMVGGRPETPEWAKRAFMRQLWDCEECRDALLKGGLVKPH